VEDALQDVFITAYRRLEDLRPDASSKAWLFGIALRVAQNYRRRLKRVSGFVELDERQLASDSKTPFERAAERQALALLGRFLESLDEEKRSVFVLMELEGWSAPEVSQALSIRLNTVYSRLRVARERFVQAVDEHQVGGHHE
jgi:RNA polymerase sigma-70 factor (ECF subfamily)